MYVQFYLITAQIQCAAAEAQINGKIAEFRATFIECPKTEPIFVLSISVLLGDNGSKDGRLRVEEDLSLGFFPQSEHNGPQDHGLVSASTCMHKNQSNTAVMNSFAPPPTQYAPLL